MATVIFDISMSLDGYIAAPGQSPEEPAGHGGEMLHDWFFGEDEANAEYVRRAGASTEAIITGRTTYQTSLPWWEADGPTGSARKPVIVVTHEEDAEAPKGGVYTFATNGIQQALAAAKQAAGAGDITIMGGANIGQQFIAAGLVDELSLHLVPVLFGGGTRMFDHPFDITTLRLLESVETPRAVHLRYSLKD